ncbi:MAG TPA: Rieske 2Fe-2S domain-containing protein [Rhodopila sp.]|uniref:aromatic ring-hydroxylating oxygenase subunit alpha n=1 Tax=Rhodopila sp. TaxID=2480087 RepID=UPI002CF20B1B|nr:Rieske 2Fe-2S domain-containing protein [Rhodopila sp.]HVY17998.1 Rieske 2Fe-2S domain-containing protein [Rhodopila sp.]
MPEAPAGLEPSAYPPWTGDVTRVPYWVYREPALLKTEQQRVFEGPVWNFLCLESEIPESGDWRATQLGQMPVVVARGADGSIAAFENRCAHRGALICLDNAGKGAKDFQCVYHAWRYDLHGNLASVAFQRGVNGKGGMPADFRLSDHGPRKLRVTTLLGLVFATLHDDTPDIETFIGVEVLAQMRRIIGDRQVEIIGRFTEVLPNNWKMYAENVRDSYHASLLHLFFATFRINRLSQGGGLIISPNGGCSVSSSIAPDAKDDPAYAGMRSAQDDYQLEDRGLIDVVDEHPDRIRQQIITVFPNFAMQKTQNAMAMRFFVPDGVDRTRLEWIYFGYADDTEAMRKRRMRHLNLGGPAGFVSMEDGCIGNFVERGIATAEADTSIVAMGGSGTETQQTRATEAAVRGFWALWRRMVAL